MESRTQEEANSSRAGGNTGLPSGGVPRPALDRDTRIAPVDLWPLLDEARRVGADARGFFRGLGFAASDLDTPGFTVSHIEATTIVRRALLAFNNPMLGLELGLRSRITDLGALALGMLASATLDQAIDLGLRFPASAGYLLQVTEQRSPSRHVLVAEAMPDSLDIAVFLVDRLFASLVRQRRQLCEADCSPLLVELARPRPVNAAAYEQFFRSPVRFNSGGNRLVMDSSWLAWPLPTASARSYMLAQQLLEREAEHSRGASGLGRAVQRALQLALPRVLTPAEIASQLHLSERSLRRKLALEKLSFRGLLEDCRKLRALDLVLNGRRSLAEAAAETGFADPRSFRRAFNRWTGSAPSELRARHRKTLRELPIQTEALEAPAAPEAPPAPDSP